MFICTINIAQIDKHSVFIINNNNNNKQRKNMNNLKKIGLTALAASLVSTSVFAGEVSVSGGAAINFENYSMDTSAGAKAAGTKAFSMGNQLTFTGSGELDNGMNVAISFVIDQGDDAAAANGPFDSHSVTLSSDAMGTLKFHGEGGDSAQNAVGDTAAGNIWDNFDTKNGTSLKESNATNNMMHYTLPSMVDGLTVAASYVPGTSLDASDTAYSLSYTGIEGLTVSYGLGSNDGRAPEADDSAPTNEQAADASTIKLSYVYGSVTLAYSDHEYDSALADGTEDQDATSWKVSYAVSDAISITYAEEEIDSGTANDQDASYSKLSTSYTSGGMTLSANMQEMENGDFSTNASSDADYVGLSVSFAF
jgi:outer membrane protein OmpU